MARPTGQQAKSSACSTVKSGLRRGGVCALSANDFQCLPPEHVSNPYADLLTLAYGNNLSPTVGSANKADLGPRVGPWAIEQPAASLSPPPFVASPTIASPAATPQRPSRESTALNLMRGYTGDAYSDRVPPEYIPRTGGLGDEVARRQFNRASAFGYYDNDIRRPAEPPAETIVEEPADPATDADWQWRIAHPFGDFSPTFTVPAADAYASDTAVASFIIDEFAAAGIFTSELPGTTDDNRDIIRMVQEEVRACGKEAEHLFGADKKERILRDESGKLLGSRRPDGTLGIGDPENPDYIFDFNTVDVRPSQGNRLTTREELARLAILALKERIDKLRTSYFAVYPKSKGKDRKKWREEIRPLVRDAVRAWLNC